MRRALESLKNFSKWAMADSSTWIGARKSKGRSVSWVFVAAAWKYEGLGMVPKLILLALADAVDKKTGYAWRSLDYIAKRKGP